MSTVIPLINLKGGVGKTTTTVALAEMYADDGKKVLVVDLDPQTNATVMLISEKKWETLDNAGQTIAQLFQDALEPDTSKKVFDLSKAVQTNVGTVAGLRGIDLLPSSLRLIDVQDRLATMPAGKYFTKAATDILNTAIKRVIDKYDVVLIDCPPNMGIITLNGLRIANGYIIPTIPDVLSTYGIPQIVQRVTDFAAELNEDIEAYGIVITKFRAASTLHLSTHKQLISDAQLLGRPRVFATVVPEGNAIASSAENTYRGTLRQKYAYQGGYEVFKKLSAEVANVAGIA